MLLLLQGCGLVTMGSHEEAVAAIQGLDSKYTWEGMDSTMVVKWMDVAMQRRRREQHLAAVRQGLVPNFAVSECEGGHLGTQAGKGPCWSAAGLLLGGKDVQPAQHVCILAQWLQSGSIYSSRTAGLEIFFILLLILVLN